LALVIWRIFPKKEALGPLSDKPSLAIMYFKNNTGDKNLDHWRNALSDLLITSVSQSKYIRVLSGEVLYDILNNLKQLEAATYSSEVLKQVALRGRSDRVLVGNYSKAGDMFRISVAILEGRSAELIESASVEGVGEASFYAMVDELTRTIKSGFEKQDVRIAHEVGIPVEKITTRSPEAYKLYSEGRIFHLRADYWKSLSIMQKALDIDPEFAMAWRSVSVSYYNLGMRPARLEAMKKAFELRDRVSERERYIIEADYYKTSEKTYDKALSAYLQLLKDYPDDNIGNTNIGILYFELEEWDKAAEHYKRNIQNYPDSQFSYWNLAEVYEAMGLYDKAVEALEQFLKRNPETATFQLKLIIVYLLQGRYDLASAKLEQIRALDSKTEKPVEFWKSRIDLLTGNLAGAEKVYREMPEENKDKRILLSQVFLLQGKYQEAEKLLATKPETAGTLAYFYLRSGRPQEALRGFEKIWEEAKNEESTIKQALALCAKGIAFLQMRSVDEAFKMASEIRSLVQAGMHKKAIRYYDFLMGMIELEKKNYAQAISFLEAAVGSLYEPDENLPKIQALFRSGMGRAYYEGGSPDKAREEYEKVITLNLGRIDFGDLYSLSFYWLGKIAERQGLTTKAIEHYQKFLELWKDADPGIVEVGDARTRLSVLKST
jgi:tetratricopeptide (TPR) repeat protein